jgi:NitT/TauT family transport system ATP-binding protein
MNARLSCNELSKRFVDANTRDTVHALGPITLEVPKGQFLAIVGPSGCGKSTLMSIFAGLVRPSAGQALLDGRLIQGPGPERGVCFQDYALFPWLSVLDNVAFGLRARGIPARERELRARAFINRVNLTGFENKYPHQLSGGMRQRCALARVLANEPEVLLMDEPMAALDAQTRQILQDDLLRIWGDGPADKTVLYITHSIDEAVYLADRIVVMSARPGTVKADIRNDFMRPRAAVREMPEFARRTNEIWQLIRDDALQALAFSN